MKKIQLNLSFKGNRNYIHGTDMLNNTIKFLFEEFDENINCLRFDIHKMTHYNLIVNICPAELVSNLGPDDIATFKFNADDKSWNARLSNTTEKPTTRYPYNEDIIAELCTIDISNRSIVLKNLTPFTAIETFVSMTKTLHLKLFPQIKCHWVFCGWESPKWSWDSNLQDIKIQLTQSFGTRLTKSAVYVTGQMRGHIYFSARVQA